MPSPEIVGFAPPRGLPAAGAERPQQAGVTVAQEHVAGVVVVDHRGIEPGQRGIEHHEAGVVGDRGRGAGAGEVGEPLRHGIGIEGIARHVDLLAVAAGHRREIGAAAAIGHQAAVLRELEAVAGEALEGLQVRAQQEGRGTPRTDVDHRKLELRIAEASTHDQEAPVLRQAVRQRGGTDVLGRNQDLARDPIDDIGDERAGAEAADGGGDAVVGQLFVGESLPHQARDLRGRGRGHRRPVQVAVAAVEDRQGNAAIGGRGQGAAQHHLARVAQVLHGDRALDHFALLAAVFARIAAGPHPQGALGGIEHGHEGATGGAVGVGQLADEGECRAVARIGKAEAAVAIAGAGLGRGRQRLDLAGHHVRQPGVDLVVAGVGGAFAADALDDGVVRARRVTDAAAHVVARRLGHGQALHALRLAVEGEQRGIAQRCPARREIETFDRGEVGAIAVARETDVLLRQFAPRGPVGIAARQDVHELGRGAVGGCRRPCPQAQCQDHSQRAAFPRGHVSPCGLIRWGIYLRAGRGRQPPHARRTTGGRTVAILKRRCAGAGPRTRRSRSRPRR